ncbi:amidase [Pseudonocardia kujensis]|uniref:amidase n=1 Tax=Pseudonocardia kujensis TaxID=1128675 RepID=UPI001E349E37|nr:amidase [Pseudonocardia kujensis]MCE0768200.1 amidase [Pseudonocardia kujensis]
MTTLTEAAAALRAGTTTSRALTEAAIATADRLDARVGTYLARFDDHARAAADRADAELAAGHDRGPLHGIPFGVKDILAMAEGPTTAQSLVLDRTWGENKDAPVVARLKAAGAVITGKTTTMEFACGMPDPAKPFPVPRNPWDLQTWPGGSSSGTGSGVAAGMFLAGLGTDTAGSIRIPAALCGITGLMPTFGRVPKSGCVPLGYSLDHIGPMARSAADCAAVLAVIAGPHASDPDCVDAPFTAPELGGDLAGLRIGVVREGHFPAGADPALAGAFDAAVAQLEASGATTVEVALPYRAEMMTADIVTMACEALAYHRTDMTTRWDDYFTATRAMIAQGAMVSGADYVQAQRMRRAGQLALGRLFAEIDVVVCPTLSVGAPALQDYLDGTADVMDLFTHIHTGYWDSVGNPVLALPMGQTAGGMPLSLQIAGRPFEEATLLRAGAAFQTATDHHLKVPALATAGAPAAA